MLRHEGPTWQGQGKEFVDSIASVLERLLDYKKAEQVSLVTAGHAFLGCP